MKPYSFETESGTETDAVKGFFRESLLHYLSESGIELPVSMKNGKDPAVTRGAHGKPYFCEPGLERVFFSLSHTRGRTIICFSDSEIGADCENTETRTGIAARCGRVAARCFADDERGWLASADAADGANAGEGLVSRFFEIWTAKEAYMKYTGNGFSEGFRSFSVLSPPRGVFIETGRLEGAPHIVYSVCRPKREPD